MEAKYTTLKLKLHSRCTQVSLKGQQLTSSCLSFRTRRNHSGDVSSWSSRKGSRHWAGEFAQAAAAANLQQNLPRLNLVGCFYQRPRLLSTASLFLSCVLSPFVRLFPDRLFYGKSAGQRFFPEASGCGWGVCHFFSVRQHGVYLNRVHLHRGTRN